MTLVYLLLVYGIVALIFLSIRPLTTAMHELGHAIPALLLTRKKVTIYLGSYGDPDKSYRFQIGLLEVWFKYNPISWNRGICMPSAKEISITKQIIYTMLGPVASITIATVGCFLIFDFDGHGAIKMFFVILVISAIFDLLINLYPSNTPIKIHDGRITYNDGHQLRELFKHGKYVKDYSTVNALFIAKKFEDALILVRSLMNAGSNDPNLLRWVISIDIELGDSNDAMIMHERLKSMAELDSNDYCKLGLILSRKNLPREAVKEYLKSLQLNPTNIHSLANLAYTYNLIGNYEDAIVEFNKSIELAPEFSYGYANRGLSKIKLGRIDDGTKDINYSLELDANNSYAYRALGIVQLDEGNKEIAKELFLKSKELDSKTQGIDQLIIQSA